MKRVKKLFTIGYEGCDIEAFCRFLKQKKISLLIDVRKNPVSRKRGFSKNKLAENLGRYKINYIHNPNVGVPQAWRQLAKKKQLSRKKMFQDYQKKILPRCKEDLKNLLDIGVSNNTVLMCFENEATDCHRHFLAKKLKKISPKKMEIVDLNPRVERTSLMA